MKSRREIEERLAGTSSAFEIDILRWVLSNPQCSFCALANRREFEVGIHKGEITPSYLEERMAWPTGTVMRHMDLHVEYDHEEASHIEVMRSESIDTLDAAQDIVGRLLGWLDELEAVKDSGAGITSEWIADATKLVGQANTSLRLVGQLKKEIGVDSQLLLAQKQMDGVMGVLVNTRSKNERVNAVAFSGDPVDNDDRVLINAQIGSLDVVSADPGVVPEVIRVTVSQGEAIEINREQGSSEVTGVVFEDAEVTEVAVLLDSLTESFPIDEEPPSEREVLLDTEWKVLSDGRLVIKQIRPFLR